ncbi:MAG TPA: type II secretion system protein GspL [Candidatus Dormibacteraeota bacterium]|nr:type II secretion system protein GspL [Candidatus Dormibacteraeota bacterium]
MAQRILALEMGGDRVRAAVADRSWNSFHLAGVYEKLRAQDETDLSGALSRLVAEAGEPDIVISALPSDRVAKRLLELPFKDARRLHQVVPFALEEHLPFPVDNGAVAFSRFGQEGDHTLVMAAMVRKIDLQHHLDLLAKAGLDPKIVTLAPLALAAMLTRSRNGTNGAKPMAHLVVEGDESSTSVVLVDLEGTPRALRAMRGGLMTSDGSAVSQDEATPILDSMRQTLLAHGGEIDKTDVIVAGAASGFPKVRGMLSDSLAVSVRDGGAFDYSGYFEGNVPTTGGKFASCLAMLLGELPTKPLNLINFRSGEFLFRGRVRGDLSPFYTSGILGAALFAVIALHFILGVSANLHRLHLVDAEIAAVAGPILGESDPADATKQLKSGIAKMNERLKLMGANMTHHSPLDTLVAVSHALPPRFPVEMADVQIDANALRVTGQADSFATVDQAKHALDASGYFGTIQVTHAKAGSDPNKVDFRLDATFKDAISTALPDSDE